MDCTVTDQLNSELSSSSSPAAMSALQEATGDSESDSEADVSSVDADDGDAESCSGGDGGGSMEPQGDVVSWECCWAIEQSASEARYVAAVGGGDAGVCMVAEDAVTGDAESDRLFWEACIAHGY